MRMRILLLLITLSLASCYVLLPHTKVSDGFTPARGLLTSENVKLQFFWELGVVVRTNEHLYLRDGYGNKDLLIGAVNGTNAKKRVLPMELCGDVGVSIEPSKEGTFDAKCVWRIDGWLDINKIDYLVDKAFFEGDWQGIAHLLFRRFALGNTGPCCRSPETDAGGIEENSCGVRGKERWYACTWDLY